MHKPVGKHLSMEDQRAKRGLLLQGCRCDGFVEHQSRLQGMAPGSLAAGYAFPP